MPVLKRRSRIVSFRLSQEEYDALKDTCVAQGARSISDFARSAACRLARNGNGFQDEALQAAVLTLQGRVEELDRELKRLAHLLEASRPATPEKKSKLAKFA
jgi:uncharacterized protein (DUF1778 family)